MVKNLNITSNQLSAIYQYDPGGRQLNVHAKIAKDKARNTISIKAELIN
jgi:hypothetical protein